MSDYTDGWLELKVIRRKDGLSLRKLSRLSKVSLGHLSDMENGVYTPSFEIIKKLARTLNVPVSVLEPGNRDADQVAERLDAVRDDELSDAA